MLPWEKSPLSTTCLQLHGNICILPTNGSQWIVTIHPCMNLNSMHELNSGKNGNVTNLYNVIEKL